MRGCRAIARGGDLFTLDGGEPARMVSVSGFDELVDDAERARLGVWDFSCLDGRAGEDRPTWHFFDRVPSAPRACRRCSRSRLGWGR
jgi:hypothetical protein